MNAWLSRLVLRVWNGVRERRNAQIVSAIRSSLASCGPDTVIHPSVGVVAPENVTVGEHVLLGPGVWISAVNTRIAIGSHVMTAPQVALVAGNHNTSVLGRFMDEVEEKRPEDDEPIVVEDDVWLGLRAIVLKGVTVGRGQLSPRVPSSCVTFLRTRSSPAFPRESSARGSRSRRSSDTNVLSTVAC